LRTVTTYIPTEVLTLYVAVVAALQPAGATPAWITFWCFLICTPVVVWVVYAIKAKTAKSPFPAAIRTWPLWEMIAGSIAYVAWAFALPGSPFASWAHYSAALAGVIVLVASTILGLLAPLFARSIPS
jgi:hypothetical protein